MGTRAKTLELAVDASNQAKMMQQELGRLQRQLKRQRAITQALWQLVREKLALAEDDLFRLAVEIERAEKDGPRIAELCPHCGRSLQENHLSCIYCGAEIKRREQF